MITAHTTGEAPDEFEAFNDFWMRVCKMEKFSKFLDGQTFKTPVLEWMDAAFNAGREYERTRPTTPTPDHIGEANEMVAPETVEKIREALENAVSELREAARHYDCLDMSYVDMARDANLAIASCIEALALLPSPEPALEKRRGQQ